MTGVVDKPLAHLPFDQWLVHVFDHDVRTPQWYFDLDAPYWNGAPHVTAAYLTTLFENPVPTLEVYSDAQLNQGFWYLLSSSASDHMFALLDERVALDARLRCIGLFVNVFEQIFDPRCSPHLSHIDEPGAVLNGACYMWWDIIPIYGRPDVPSRREVDEACLRVMEQVVAFESIACRESALHGLGHWHLYYPRDVERIVDAFLAADQDMRPELTRYAHAARRGHVL